MIEDFNFASATTLAKLIASRRVSIAHLIEWTVMQAKDAQTRLNCFAVPLFEEALEAAAVADRCVANGDRLGPLHGIPITIKDGVATAGHRLPFGSASRADAIAESDDIVWQRLKAAGAILIGKTTTPEFFHKVVTDSPLFGVTRNPWSLAHTPGGSSGGAAAALAAGVTPIAVGTDGGGSLRCPASCTGILALKPTTGRVPHGQFPDTFGNYSAIGPMARHVGDLATMLTIMSGPAEADASSLGIPRFLTGDEDPSLKDVKIGWIDNPGSYGADPRVVAIARSALDALAETGGRVVTIDGTLLDNVFETYLVIGATGHAARVRSQEPGQRRLWSQSFQALVAKGLTYSADDLQRAQEQRTQLFRRVQSVFDTIDVIATPTLTAPPLPLGADGSVGNETFAAWAAALYPFNLTGHPAISVPAGLTDEGLPVGLQLVARWYDETLLIKLAGALEAFNPYCARSPLQ
jgi:aspartyl-tRNA(Asn)/glutamyl-tRNA(Gln) amidotransferase subunit A